MDWKIDQEAFEKAKKILGITLPVRVRFVDRSNSTDTMTGKYHGIGHWGVTTDKRLDEPAHHISISASSSAYSANEVLWHEMTHAAQAEDFLPAERNGMEPYRAANRGMRMAFAKELRDMGKSYSYDVSFERDANDFMKNGKALKIIVSDFKRKKGKDKKEEDDTEEFEDDRRLFRVDMWKAKTEGGAFHDTVYIRADSDTDAKNFARKEYMDGLRYSVDVECHEISEIANVGEAA